MWQCIVPGLDRIPQSFVMIGDTMCLPGILAATISEYYYYYYFLMIGDILCLADVGWSILLDGTLLVAKGTVPQAEKPANVRPEKLN